MRGQWQRWQAARLRDAELRALRELSPSVLRDIGAAPESIYEAQRCSERPLSARDAALRPDVGAAARRQMRWIVPPAVLFSRAASAAAMRASGSTSCAAPRAMASRGMPNTTQLASSWQML